MGDAKDTVRRLARGIAPSPHLLRKWHNFIDNARQYAIIAHNGNKLAQEAADAATP
jgi:hypothetical protein